ncbi:hypothetical protein D3P07_15810 [Paenibacillus sp. 1011MAR3C5]|uniref:hypothetical protein n=1 Tax=Paenibacillus sp. 1011MAR3C5 TaxID=1675787 RepID=UPI000E6D2795|nr:hypothetical protein [Paenibacillus sp. 1011MAR3C5]RJE87762.1 hypothetical protein D3P07_15810 [Paenibacillus sp. 1011MAR3C5]
MIKKRLRDRHSYVAVLAFILAGTLGAYNADHVHGAAYSHNQAPIAEDQGHEHQHEHEHQHQHEHDNHDAEEGQLYAEWSFQPNEAAAGQAIAIDLQIADAEGEPLQKFEDNHERKLHLIIVGEDLGYFDHVHPEYAGNGLFRQYIVLPEGGKYKLFADFQPAGYAHTTVSTTLHVDGEHKFERMIEDQERVKTTDKAVVELAASALAAGQESELAFTFRHPRTGAALTDLQPYLGAIGHVVIISEDLEQYLHVHPVNERGNGPEARFVTSFPAEGLYRIWGQFQREGETFIVPFTVRVQ